jgi:hypothetical protein
MRLAKGPSSGGSVISGESKHLTDEDCLLCGALEQSRRIALRKQLFEIPTRDLDAICDECMDAFTGILVVSFPKTGVVQACSTPWWRRSLTAFIMQ